LVDPEPGARPFNDWNERIHAECYRPNAHARISDQYGRVERVVNNYSNLSFNFGPTLLTWLERRFPDTYARVLSADRESARRRGGHGNAIAQGYHHAILPLCNERDRRTQIRGGVADFRLRFGREPESLWLPEAACDDATLDALIEEGLKYVVLSPLQAGRVRPLGSDEWRDVSDGGVDTIVPYLYFHSDGAGRSLAVFFYDGGIARAVAFEGLLASSHALVGACAAAAARAGAQIVNVATDGESYGHHLAGKFGGACGGLLSDPWAARDAYVELLVDRAAPREDFLRRHAAHALSRDEQVRALTLLEAQRMALAMYASCGWFFNDVSG